MRLIRNPQLWLSLAKEIWDRNRGQNIKQIAASLAFTTTLSLVPMVTLATILIGYLPSVIQIKNTFRYWLLDTYMPGGFNQQILVYLDQFSSKARGLTYIGLIGLVITTIMTLVVIEGAFNQIFKVPFLNSNSNKLKKLLYSTMHSNLKQNLIYLKPSLMK